MSHTVELLLELGGVMLGLGILGVIAGKFGISPIPLYLLAGLGFGVGGVDPLDAVDEFIEVGAEIGVVLLLFMLGLEYTAGELLGTMKRSAFAGALDLALNATPGFLLALVLGWGFTAAIVLGGVTYISSSGVVAKVLSDLGWLGNRETPTVLSILVMEDLVMAVYLPIVTTVLAGLALYQAAYGMAIAAGAVTMALLVAAKYGGALEWFLRSPSNEVLLLKVLGVVLVVAGLAEQVHVSAAVGAFLVGIALSGEMTHDVERLLLPLKDLFAAIFFVNFGLQTDPGDLPPVLAVAVGLALVTAVTKVVTGLVAAKRAGVGPTGAMRAGVALIPRGEFSIVIAGLGLAAGVNAQLGPLAAAYVLILAVIGPLAARVIEPIMLRRRRRARLRRTLVA